MKKLPIILATLFLIFLAIGCSSTNAPNYQEGDSTEVVPTPPEPLEILDSKLVPESYGGYSITGTAKANKDLSYAEVTAKCYGSDGTVIGSYLTNMNNLGSGETWNFKVIGPTGQGVRVSNYTIANGNSF